MYSKNDKDLRISQIHHKRKENLNDKELRISQIHHKKKENLNDKELRISQIHHKKKENLNDKELRISQIHHKRKENLNDNIKRLDKGFEKNIFRKTLGTILTILIIGLSIGIASGSTYYVAKNGSDSNPGTETRPWLTIGKAANMVIAGDTVYIKSGIYRERLIPKNSGSPGMSITFVPYPGNTVIIDGRGLSMSSWQGLVHIYGKGYIKISGFRIMNSSQAGVRVDKSHHITIENNYIYNIELSPIKIGWSYSSNIVIDRNIIDRPYKNTWNASYYAGWQEAISVSNTETVEVKSNRILRNGKGECIDLKDGTKHGKVYKNIIDYCSAVGIYIDAYTSPYQYDINVYQNTIRHASIGIMLGAEKGGTLRHVKVYNNLVYNNERPGIIISSYSLTGYQPKIYNVSIINNIVDKNRAGVVIQKDRGNNLRVSNVIIRNNIVSNNIYSQITVESGYPYVQNLVIDHNLVFGTRGYYENDGKNVTYADPQYMNRYAYDFRPKSISPSVDRGSSSNAPMTDFRDLSRPQGSRHDIGAYEYFR